MNGLPAYSTVTGNCQSFKFETRRSINSKSFGGISEWGVDDRVDSTNFEKRLLIE